MPRTPRPRKPGEWTPEVHARLEESLTAPLRPAAKGLLLAASCVVLFVGSLWVAFAVLRGYGLFLRLNTPQHVMEPASPVPPPPPAAAPGAGGR